jgi:extradiol dioxygenase family protein
MRWALFKSIDPCHHDLEGEPSGLGYTLNDWAIGIVVMSLRPFHLAFPVHDLAAARTFWGGVMGCPEGRSAPDWIDFDFYGHQIVAHLVGGADRSGRGDNANRVDGHEVPVPHFGIVLTFEQWQSLADRLTAAGTEFVIEPHIRFKGQVGEQATMFFRDPSGNAIEMKAFKDLDQLFAK